MVDIQIRRIEPRTVAYLHRTGAFDEIPGAMSELFAWLGDHGLEAVAAPGGRYFTHPATTPLDRNEWEVFVEIAVPREFVPPEGDEAHVPRVRDLHAMDVAVARHRGPYDQVARTYAVMGAWLGEHGYAVAGPSEEIYLSEPDVAPEDILTEVRVPVVPAAQPVPQPV